MIDTPLDAAIFACLMMTFYVVARLGEFTVRAIKEFDLAKHVIRANMSRTTDHNGLPATKFHLPRLKCSPTEEDTYWAAQEGPSDPSAALENHFRINPAGGEVHLFVWKHTKGLRLLSKKELIKRLVSIAVAANLPDLKGHGLHIGGTLEYLLQGVPFKVIKLMGRWSSEMFTKYLRDYATIITPYI